MAASDSSMQFIWLVLSRTNDRIALGLADRQFSAAFYVDAPEMAVSACVGLVYGDFGWYFGLEFILCRYFNRSGFSLGISVWEKQRFGLLSRSVFFTKQHMVTAHCFVLYNGMASRNKTMAVAAETNGLAGNCFYVGWQCIAVVLEYRGNGE